MKTTDLDYELPEALIARRPPAERTASRLMHLSGAGEKIGHHLFRDLPTLLEPGDRLVMNRSRVIPARLIGRRHPEGGRVEALLIAPEGTGRWRALVRPGKRIRVGARLVFEPGVLEAEVLDYGAQGSGERLLEFDYEGDWDQVLQRVGHTPLPPYILHARRNDAHGGETTWEEADDRDRYQTVYADDQGLSVAAPTAGLHFDQALLAEIERCGIDRSFIRLDVGAGTFQPIKTDRVEAHPMHAEAFEIGPEAAAEIAETRKAGGRIVAVGTTVVRTLETAALVQRGEAGDVFEPADASAMSATYGAIAPLAGWTRLMIRPGHRFRAIDAMLTNFHLPRSSLLALVAAFAGLGRIRAAYREAIEQQYRFYSYGDCMLIEP